MLGTPNAEVQRPILPWWISGLQAAQAAVNTDATANDS